MTYPHANLTPLLSLPDPSQQDGYGGPTWLCQKWHRVLCLMGFHRFKRSRFKGVAMWCERCERRITRNH